MFFEKIFNSVIVRIIGAAILGLISAFVGFWIYLKPRLNKIEKDLYELKTQTKNIEDKYIKGYNPETMCEHCHEGRYCYQRTEVRGIGTVFEVWTCEKCGQEASFDWVKQHRKH